MDAVVGIIILLVMLFSAYSLYTSYQLFQSGSVSDSLKAQMPTRNAETGKMDFADVKSINPDVRAWITVDHTKIGHPVVQGKDNMEYVNKNLYGEFAFEGAIFLDCRNEPNFHDIYSLLYGHHMEHGGMFGDLHLFLEASFFEKNRTGVLLTEEGEYPIDFFALVETSGYDEVVFKPTALATRDDLIPFLSYIQSKSTHYREPEIGDVDRIIGLSTCESANTNGRLILYGVLRGE